MDIKSNSFFLRPAGLNITHNAAVAQANSPISTLPSDVFTSSGSPENLGILSPRQALAFKATSAVAASTTTAAAPAPAPGTNIGALGPNDPVVPAATRHAGKVAGDKVDWKHPEQALANLSQFDRRAEVGGSDPTRCGAAVIVGAGILNGPEAFEAGLSRISDRAFQVLSKLQAIDSPMARDAAASVEKALDILGAYSEKGAAKLTNADMSKIQDAIYRIAHADQMMNNDGASVDQGRGSDPYLTTNAVGEYFKLMTGAEAPSHNGKSVQPYYVKDNAGHGHFVLGDQDGNVTYNPWPEANGKAFSAGNGQTAPKVVGGITSPGELQGGKVTDYFHTLPSRA